MMNLKHIVLAATLIALPCTSVLAQGTTYKQRHSIRARQARQQARINRGVRDGQITPGGAAGAERHQAQIARQERTMRAADGGHLTASDRHQIAHEQNATSKGIYNRNHNGVTDPGVTPR